jgi:hypothetical protein
MNNMNITNADSLRTFTYEISVVFFLTVVLLAGGLYIAQYYKNWKLIIFVIAAVLVFMPGAYSLMVRFRDQGNNTAETPPAPSPIAIGSTQPARHTSLSRASRTASTTSETTPEAQHEIITCDDCTHTNLALHVIRKTSQDKT